jgi:hypothetical protein
MRRRKRSLAFAANLARVSLPNRRRPLTAHCGIIARYSLFIRFRFGPGISTATHNILCISCSRIQHSVK